MCFLKFKIYKIFHFKYSFGLYLENKFIFDMETNKSRVVVDYEKLSEELVEQIKLVYPSGFSQHLIEFVNSKREKVTALRFETFEKVYLIRMTNKKAEQLIRNDSDYDKEGNLIKRVREKYEEEHSDIDYLPENDNYEDDWY